MKNRSNKNGSRNDEWETPDSLFNELTEEFHFNWDLACTSKNIKTVNGSMVNKDNDGLTWMPDDRKEYSIWCNPPYDRKLKEKFIIRCLELSLLPNVKNVVMLLPNSTETKLFHDLLVPNCEIRLLYKRVKFMGTNTEGKYVTNKTGQGGSMVCIFSRQSLIIPHKLTDKSTKLTALKEDAHDTTTARGKE